MNPYIVQRVILPAWQSLRRQNSLQLLGYLETTQWLPTNELLDLQWQRIGALLKHAYEHVPYYREIMREKTLDPASVAQQRSLAKLPLLDRSTIIQQLDRLRAANLPCSRFVKNGTGGSTGEPLVFFDDRDECGWSDAAVWRSHRWYGVDVGDRCAYLWGANFDLSKYQSFSGRLKSRALNLLMLPAWELSEATADRFWNQLVNFRPKLLVAYTGAIYNWARLLGNDHDPVPGLSAIVVSAETLYDEWRTVIEQCFKVPVYNRYGGRDIKFIAQECPSRRGLHINSELALVEIIRDGQTARPGELGEIVLTRLDNFAMPFVRYRSGDLGILASSACECGRSLPLLQKVEGRIQDTILTADSKVLSGPFFAHLMKDCPDVKEFQVHQVTIRRLVILVVLQNDGRFSSKERIERITQEYLGDSMQVDFEIVTRIPLTRNGKRRVIVSHLTTHGLAISSDLRQDSPAP